MKCKIIDLKEGGLLKVGITSSSILNLSADRNLVMSGEDGLDRFIARRRKNPDQIFDPGASYALISKLLALNGRLPDLKLVDVMLLSKNSKETNQPIIRSLSEHRLDINLQDSIYTKGSAAAEYLKESNLDLFLSTYPEDVIAAINMNIAAAKIYNIARQHSTPFFDGQIRVAFDGDAVLFSADSEVIYKKHGLEAFVKHEVDNARTPLAKGPFYNVLKIMTNINSLFPEAPPFHISLVTARGEESQDRVFNTFEHWGVELQEHYFLNGRPKAQILRDLLPDIFFDDQKVHIEPVSQLIASGRVYYTRESYFKLSEALRR